jgi:ATP-dependent helicase HrpA
VVAYPTLVDEEGTVALRFLASPAEQRARRRQGYARLALNKLGATTRYLRKQALPLELELLFAPLGGAERLRDELLLASAWQCFFEGRALPDTALEFNAALKERRSELAARFAELVAILRRILEVRHELMKALEAASSPAFEEAVADLRRQAAELVPATVLSDTPADVLPEVPRYLEAMRYRLDHLQGKVTRDADLMLAIGGLEERVARLKSASAAGYEDWQRFRYLLEEVRVGLFAEPLKRRGAPSLKRFDRELGALERELGLI